MPDAEEPVRLLVLSDLHAFEGADTGSPSMLPVSAASGRADLLFSSCLDKVREVAPAGVDVVICPGDLTDKIDEGALRAAWLRLCDLADNLNATLVATAGNHDYDSRGQRGVSPKQALLRLNPPFPAGQPTSREQYFTWDVASVDGLRLELLTLNSSANHGLIRDEKPEYEHGRVLPVTVERVRHLLEARESRQEIRVLVTHHHVQPLPVLDLHDRSTMEDAHLLTEVLAEDGQWIIIHGHKHRPYIQWAGGSGSAPLVLSAASFAVDLKGGGGPAGGDFSNTIRNQFHLLEFAPVGEASRLDLPLAATVTSWTWDPRGWCLAGPTDGLPGHTGIGWRMNVARLADDVRTWLVDRGGEAAAEDLLAWNPRFRYINAFDLRNLVARLAAGTPPVVLDLDQHGRITRLEVWP